MRSWCRGAVVVLSLPLVAASDKPKTPQLPLPTLGEAIEVSIVNVDVFVTDRAGNRVRGLTRDDFEVFESGARQPITHFAEYARKENRTVGVEAGPPDVAPASAGPAETLVPQSPPAPQRRTVAVFVERFRLPKPLADPVFASMKKLLHDTARPGDAVTVLTWYRGKLKTLQTYTDDLAAIDQALDAVARQNTTAMRDTYADERRERDEIEDYEVELEEMVDDPEAAARLRARRTMP